MLWNYSLFILFIYLFIFIFVVFITLKIIKSNFKVVFLTHFLLCQSSFGLCQWTYPLRLLAVDNHNELLWNRSINTKLDLKKILKAGPQFQFYCDHWKSKVGHVIVNAYSFSWLSFSLWGFYKHEHLPQFQVTFETPSQFLNNALEKVPLNELLFKKAKVL